MDLVWDTLTPEAVTAIGKGAFEDFCRELLDLEWSDRHDLRSEVSGPEAPDTAEGGCDLLFTVNAPPQTSAAEYKGRYGVRPLTPDEGCRAYSCKTGKGWQKKAIEEAKGRSARVVRVLEQGGTFTLLVHRPVVARSEPPLKRTKGKGHTIGSSNATAPDAGESPAASSTPESSIVEALAEAYAKRMPAGGPTKDTLRERIHIVDANDLHQFVRGRRPVLSAHSARRLGVQGIPGLLSLEDWRRNHALDRRPELPFVPDPKREEMRRDIVATLNSRAPDAYDRALWILGPPGIGKTRLILETLEQEASLKRRVLVAPTHMEGIAAIREYAAFERFGALVLVIDDCPPHAVLEIVPHLSKLAGDPAAAFIVLTARAPDVLPPTALHRRLSVEPLGREATAEIVRRQAGPSADPERIVRLAELAEGFPWFAALVAGEIDKGARPPVTVAEAADLALASPRDEQDRWHEVVIARARALFAIMLTEDIDWAELDDEKRENLCSAVDAASWPALEKARRECEGRGLLRVRAGGKFKYVTPEILAREVARKLLLPPPNGPGPIGPRLRRVPQWARSLYEQLERFGLSADELKQLGADVVRQVQDAGPGLAAFGHAGVPGAALRLAARHAPFALGALLRARIEQASHEELIARRDIRRDIVLALETIAYREGGFDVVEATLFHLAQAENEAYANNATGVWKTLFFIGLNPTGSPWEERFDKLRERCRSAPPELRKLGLTAIAAALSHHGVLRLPEGAEPPQVMTLQATQDARTDTWDLLLERALDEDAVVAREARRIIARELRGAVREGILDRFADRLVEVLAHFDDVSLHEVREAIEMTRTYEQETFSQAPSLKESFARVAQAAIPRSFRERLHQQVGTWGPAATRGSEQAEDEQLAREGLALPDRPLLAEIDWLLSPAALRKMSFAIALGYTDTERIMLAPIVERTRAGASPEFLSRYCIGMSDAGKALELDELLAQWRSEPGLAAAAALAIPRIPGDDRRAGYLTDIVRSGQLEAPVVATMIGGQWAKEISAGALRGLIEALLEQSSPEASTAALELILERLDLDPQPPDLREPLLRSMQRLASEDLAGMAAYAWERGGKHLLDISAVEVCSLAIRGALASDALASEHHWLLIKACEERAPDALWQAVRNVLQVGGKQAYRLATDLRWQSTGARFPVDQVLDWVGSNRQRASLVAMFAPVHADELPRLAHGLISRFGPNSTPARELASAMGSTFRAVSSLAEFHRRQLARVRRWAQDADPNVRAWAESLVKHLERSEEFHSAHEEHERRRFGT
jgi:uncharacterized protein (DUF433 family)